MTKKEILVNIMWDCFMFPLSLPSKHPLMSVSLETADAMNAAAERILNEKKTEYQNKGENNGRIR